MMSEKRVKRTVTALMRLLAFHDNRLNNLLEAVEEEKNIVADLRYILGKQRKPLKKLVL